MSGGSLVNPYLLVPIICWLVAQLMKIGFASSRGRLNFKVLVESGGMPSSHTAIVTGLAITTLINDGADSALFGFSVVLALIVIYDALNVRRAVGEYGSALNEIRKEVFKKDATELKPLLGPKGHKPTEVLAGVMVGSVVGIILQASEFKDRYSDLFSVPQAAETRLYALVLLSMIIAGVVVVLSLNKRHFNKMPTGQLILKKVKLLLIGFPVFASLFVAAQALDLPVLGERIWFYATGVAFMFVLVSSLITLVPEVKLSLDADRETFEKEKKHQKEITKKRKKRNKRKR